MKLDKNIPQDKLNQFITYFEDFCFTNDFRYGDVDFNRLFLYDYPLFLESCFNFINTLDEKNHIKDNLEEIYSILFNTNNNEYTALIESLKSNNPADLTYTSKDSNVHKLSFIHYENEYFCITQQNELVDIKIIIPNTMFKEEKYDASISYYNLLKLISKNVVI